MAGKGDDRRPTQISEEELAERWARTFDSGDRPDKARSRCADLPPSKTGPYYPRPDPRSNPDPRY